MEKRLVNSIDKGIVIDHIKPGLGIKLYHALGLETAPFTVVIFTNAQSSSGGTKDMIKIQNIIELDYAVIGLIDAGATINIIENGRVVDKKQLTLPQRVDNVIRCKNPRCITSLERDIPHSFTLNDPSGIYSCLYCEDQVNGLDVLR